MNTRILVSKHNCMIALLLPVVTLALCSGIAHAQMAVHDAAANATRTQQHSDILAQWAKDVDNFNKQFAKVQEHVQVAQETLKVIGDPAQALQKLASMGVLPQTDALASTFELARDYARRGMAAYVELQEREFQLEREGYTATRHQREVGAGYFDAVLEVVSGGQSSTLALEGSTEEAQFEAAQTA